MANEQSFKLLSDLRNFVLQENNGLAKDYVERSHAQEATEKTVAQNQVAQATVVNMQKKEKLEAWSDDFKKKTDTSKEIGRGAADSIGGAFQDFVVQIVKGGESLLKAMENLGKALLRGILEVIANDFFTKAAIYLVIAIGLAAGIITAGAAPQYFAGAAALLAAGLAVKVLAASFLASGGLVMKPTLSVLGEAGPEIVIPQDRFREFGLGGTEVGIVRANFPDFKDADQASNPGFAALVAGELHWAHQAAGI